MQQHAEEVAGKTTGEVCFKLVKPATAERKCAYVDLLRSDTRGGGGGGPEAAAVAPATVFLSHAWACPLEELVAAVEAHFAARAEDEGTAPANEPFVWLDILTVNQHNCECAGGGCACGSQRPLPPQEWWSGAFKQAIASFGHVLAVLHPWNAPVHLTRAWCLWELLCAEETGARLEIALSPAQQLAFVDALETDFASIAASLSRIDSRNATAFVPRDREMICGAVQGGCGFSTLNETVGGHLRDWVAQCGRDALAKMSREKRGTSALIDRLASLLQNQGRLAEAKPLYREALRARREVLGARHPDTLGSVNNLAMLLQKQGRLAEAEPLYHEALEARREVLGARHPNSLVSVNNLSMLLMAQNRLAEAEPLCREALEAQREVLGARHPDTLTFVNNLAMLLKRQGRLAEAEPLFREALETLREVLGARHPDTLGSVNNLASVLKAQGRLAEAEPLFREALEARREVLGARHPGTLTSIFNLAALLKVRLRQLSNETGEEADGATVIDATGGSMTTAVAVAAEAVALFQEELEGMRELHGVEHDMTLVSARSLIAFLDELGRAAEAAALRGEYKCIM